MAYSLHMSKITKILHHMCSKQKSVPFVLIHLHDFCLKNDIACIQYQFHID